MIHKVNDERPKLNDLLNDENITTIIVEHKDRLTRFGFNYIKTLLEQRPCNILVVNTVDTEKEDLMQDFISVITSFCARIYSKRRTKKQVEKIIELSQVQE
jgi:predicted site-specific integrase-resolvase